MCKNIIKRWKYHIRVAVFALCIFAVFSFGVFPMWILYPVYLVGVFLLRLYRFYCEKLEKLVFAHTGLMIVLWVMAYFFTHLRRKPLYFVLFLTLIYVIWIRLADWWMKEQIAPSGTVVIGNVVNQWPELFNVVGNKTDDEAIDFVELYRVPVVLTDHNLNSAVMDQLLKMGVMVVIYGYETTYPRYEGLQFVIPTL